MTGSSAESLGRHFVEAFNRRDPEGLVAVAHAQIDFYPTGAGGTGRSYHGHQGLRAWVEELGSGQPRHHARILEVEEIDPGRVVVSCEVIVDGAVITPSTMIGVIAEGLLIEVRGYLTDIATVRQVHALLSSATSSSSSAPVSASGGAEVVMREGERPRRNRPESEHNGLTTALAIDELRACRRPARL